MSYYTAFGLTVDSEIPLPELPPASRDEAERILIRQKALDWRPEFLDGNKFAASIGGAETLFYWEQIGTFAAERGEAIYFDPTPDVEEGLLRLPILGVVFSALLQQRGFTVLHASAVEVGGRAIGFLGDKGAGKSTTAGAFHRAGHRMITDDVLAVRRRDGDDAYEAVPAFPQLKLWPRAAAHVGIDSDRLSPLHGRVDKRSFSPEEAFPARPIPLTGLYVLGWGPSTYIEPLPQPVGYLHTVANTFTHRFAGGRPEMLAQTFGLCQQLVQSIPVQRLVREPNLDDLHEIVTWVEADVAGATAAPVCP